jgi:predicted nucleic acid-binding protein
MSRTTRRTSALEPSFFDSNVVLYLLSGDAAKADRAEALLEAGGVISVQVLNEVTSVCRRKLKMRGRKSTPCYWPLRPRARSCR